jgi:hypothetical protein
MINLDGDNVIVKIDEEVHNEMNLLFSSSMGLDDNNCDDPPKKSDLPHVEIGDAPSITLVIFPLAIFPPSMYDEQDWD